MTDHKQIYFEIGKCVLPPAPKIQYQAVCYSSLYTSISQSDFTNEDHKYLKLQKFIQEKIKENRVTKYKNQNSPQNDWITQEILKNISVRNKAWETYKNNYSNKAAEKQFIYMKNKVNTLIKKEKRNYFYNAFQNCMKNPKKMWNLISSIACNKVKIDSIPQKLVINTVTVTDCTKICESFNNFFSTIGSTLANNIAAQYHSINTYPSKSYCTQTLKNFKPCNRDEIIQIIDNFDNNISSGIDEINTKSLKCIKNLIVDNLVSCINKCLEQGVFPDILKIAKISPIYKSGQKTNPTNYRPISVLPIMSKIFERILYTRIYSYLNKIDFINKKQYGFRPKSSTLTAVIDLITNIKESIDKKQIVLGIFIDLKKAFDSVSHPKLLQKLKYLVSDKAFKILESYLINRTQIVKIGKFQSKSVKINYGIPQGSILGPLLFLIYVNDITDLKISGDLTLYADDTCIFYYGKNIDEITTIAQEDLNKIDIWFKQNLLTVNTDKTSYMIFAAKNKKIEKSFSPLTINNVTLVESNQEKYLGLLLDNKLTWKAHITKIQKKLISLLASLRNMSKYIPPKVRFTIYNSLIKPHIDYLIEIWGCAATTNLLPLQRAQNKIIKVLFKIDFLTPTETLYKNTKLLNIKQTYTYNTCLLIRKILNKKIHTQIQFNVREPSKYTKRRKITNLLTLPTARTTYGKRNIKSEGAKMYNDLPEYITNTKPFNKFKKLLKQYTINKK